MSTRGFEGFVIDGVVKAHYVQYDAYPDGLGIKTLAFAEYWNHDRLTLTALVKAVEMVQERNPPTPEQQRRYQHHANTSVGERRLSDWYVLLREQQGDLTSVINSSIMRDMEDWPADSLFCEWGYLINLDTWTFEVYQGFQEHKHDLGRFANMEQHDSGYWPVALVASFDMDELPSEEEFVTKWGDGE